MNPRKRISITREQSVNLQIHSLLTDLRSKQDFQGGFLTAIYSTINLFTVLHLAISVTLLVICWHYEVFFEMRTDVIGLAIVFPLVFSIQAAYNRREQSCDHIASMKATLHSLRLSFHHHSHKGEMITEDIDELLSGLLKKIGQYFRSQAFSYDDYNDILDDFGIISWVIESHYTPTVPAPLLSRMCENLRRFMTEFEKMRNMKLYRTPIALRAYTKLFVFFFPIVFAPLFAHIASEEGSIWGAVVMVCLFSCVLTGLDSIQDHLEHPFDGQGIDDCNFDELTAFSMYRIVTPAMLPSRFRKSSDINTFRFSDEEEIEIDTSIAGHQMQGTEALTEEDEVRDAARTSDQPQGHQREAAAHKRTGSLEPKESNVSHRRDSTRGGPIQGDSKELGHLHYSRNLSTDSPSHHMLPGDEDNGVTENNFAIDSGSRNGVQTAVPPQLPPLAFPGKRPMSMPTDSFSHADQKSTLSYRLSYTISPKKERRVAPRYR